MNSLLEFDGDVFAVDVLAAVLVFPPNEDENEAQWTVSLVLRGVSAPVNYPEDSEKQARRKQQQLVAAWKHALAQAVG